MAQYSRDRSLRVFLLSDGISYFWKSSFLRISPFLDDWQYPQSDSMPADLGYMNNVNETGLSEGMALIDARGARQPRTNISSVTVVDRNSFAVFSH